VLNTSGSYDVPGIRMRSPRTVAPVEYVCAFSAKRVTTPWITGHAREARIISTFVDQRPMF